MKQVDSDEISKQDTILELDECEQALEELYSKCEQWLCGQETSTSLLSEFNRAMRWQIVGFFGKPDDFDWDTIPKKKMDRYENFREQFENAYRMMVATEKAIESLKAMDSETAIQRAYFLGKYLQDFQYKLEL